MTVDYSKYFRSILSEQIRHIDVKYLVQLRILDNNGSDIGGGGRNFNEEHERKLQLQDSFKKLLLHYNHETITDLPMHISDASKYLSLAPKMASLRVLELDRSKTSLPDSHVDDMISFIQQNRKAFPRKHPIQLSFTCWSWHMHDHDFVIPPGSVVESNIKSYESQIMAHVERQRKSQHRLVEPLIRLLEVVGSPTVLGPTCIPFFYKNSHGIELDRLEKFEDYDKDRMDYGEGDDMQAFLRRCHHLQELTLCVGSKDLLTWAAVDALTAAGYSSEVLSAGLRFQPIPKEPLPLLTSTTSPRPGSPSSPSMTSQLLLREPRPSGILQNLRSLVLQSEGPHQFVVHALNDAMVAFAGTLCKLRVSDSRFIKPWDEWNARSIMAQRRVRMCKLLEDEPWANWIGKGPGQVLPFPLLQLRTLSICIDEAFDMEIGSFEQYPNLESLLIQYGNVSWDEPSNGIKDIVSVSQNDDGSIRARIKLFPTWNLPRLRKLNLMNMAAVRFDWGSLSSMARLEKLEMYVDPSIDSWYKPSDYLEDQKDAWKRKMDLRDKKNNNNNRDLDGLDSGIAEAWMWQLPWLHTLSLHGHPVTLFYLDWIRFCPNLESLTLIFRGYRYPIPRFSPLASPSTEPLLNLDNVDGQQQPLLHSRLSTINMDWVVIMSEHDLQTLLTIYAPFLKRIEMRGRAEYAHPTIMTLSQFLRVVHQADQINKLYAETLAATIRSHEELQSNNKDSNNNNNAANASEQEQHRRRLGTLGSTLESVNCLDIPTVLRSGGLGQLGLVIIPFEQVEKFRAKKMRVYSIGTQSLVAQVDHDLIRSETESHLPPRRLVQRRI
jgi:hypothetical protein